MLLLKLNDLKESSVSHVWKSSADSESSWKERGHRLEGFSSNMHNFMLIFWAKLPTNGLKILYQTFSRVANIAAFKEQHL